MPRQRVFLGWSKPALQSAVPLLLERSRSQRFCDLGHVITVVPGREAGRRLLELLTDAADGELIPPRILTQGTLPEELYFPQRQFASELVQQMVWAQALQAVSANVLSAIVRHPPAREDWQAWIRLGNLMRRQHEELAADLLNFADVARLGARLEGFDETERWQALSQVQQKYWELLDSHELWDRQTARLVAIERRECNTDRDIITIGTVDLNRTLRAMLDLVADRVTAFVDAPESWGDRFDDFGCLIPDQWTELEVDIDPNQLIVADDAPGQVDAVLKTLESLDGQYAIEEVAIGVPDPRLVPQLQRMLTAEGIPTFWPVDRDLSETAPYLLLQAAAAYLEDRRTQHFSSLIRHPDVTEWIQYRLKNTDWLTGWDLFVGQSLTTRVGWMPEDADDWPTRTARKLVATVHQMLAPLEGGKRKLSASSAAIRAFLQGIYGHRVLDLNKHEDLRLHQSLKAIQEAFDSHRQLPAALDQEFSLIEAIQLTLSVTGGELYRPSTEPAVRIAGWLEMPLDDAPVTIVTTFNEGVIPASVNHDLFLPNRLRSHLGIEDNTRRYARDLYNLICMIHSRPVLRLIVARRDVKNEPLSPSRLLFATSEEKIPHRVIQFYSHGASHKRRKVATAATSQFKIPRPEPRPSLPEAFRVTEFRDYLASPYRYYLRHVLKLTEVSDDVNELDGRAFGVLVHDVLKAFGQSSVKHSTQEAEIAGFLHAELTNLITTLYGPEPLPAVLVQVEQAKRRLNAFAEWQAEWRQAGWMIHSVERASESPVGFDIGQGQTAFLKGRIDRVDYHGRQKQFALFDYKTGDAGTSPDKTHRVQGEWVDLQLPLYRHLARQFDVTGDVRLGYILLPRDTNAVRECFGDWTSEELAEADDVARQVIRDILEEKFWKPLSAAPATLLEFDAICQAGVFGQEVLV